MKKIVGIIILVLALGLAGCESSVVKNGDTESVKNKIEDKVKVNEEVGNSGDKLKARIATELAIKEKEKKKQEYKTKLDNIEIGLKDLTEKGNAGTTLDMRMAQDEGYKRWDAALNEIYNVLKGQLSSSDMKKLQSEEIQWISSRDAKAKQASLEMKGGTMEPVLYAGSLAATTKNRCYELVEKYFAGLL